MLQINKVATILRYTFLDLYKSKILFNCFLLGILLLMATIIASEFTYGTPSKVAIDFGLGVTSLSTVIIAIFMGVTLVAKEIENRTVYVVLSRDISRADFILGKIFGLMGILLLNVMILFSLSMMFFVYLGGKIDSVIIFSVIFSSLEAVTCLLLVVFFSLITNSVLSVIFTAGVYIVSYTIPYGLKFSQIHYPVASKFLSVIEFIFPSFYNLNIKGHVLYKEFLSLEFLLKNLTIGTSYILGLLILITYIFNRKSLD